jgi:hypothetical protein
MSKMNIQAWTDVKIVASLAKLLIKNGYEIKKKSDIPLQCMRATYAHVDPEDIVQTDQAAIDYLKSLGIMTGEIRNKPFDIPNVPKIKDNSRLNSILDDMEKK